MRARIPLCALVVAAVVGLAAGCGQEGAAPSAGPQERAPGPTSPVETEKTGPSTAAAPEAAEPRDPGREVYEANCIRCHGDQGLGDGPKAATLYKRPANLQEHVPHHSDAKLAKFIRTGSDPMPAFDKISEEDLKHLLAYLRTLPPEH